VNSNSRSKYVNSTHGALFILNVYVLSWAFKIKPSVSQPSPSPLFDLKKYGKKSFLLQKVLSYVYFTLIFKYLYKKITKFFLFIIIIKNKNRNEHKTFNEIKQALKFLCKTSVQQFHFNMLNLN